MADGGRRKKEPEGGLLEMVVLLGGCMHGWKVEAMGLDSAMCARRGLSADTFHSEVSRTACTWR